MKCLVVTLSFVLASASLRAAQSETGEVGKKMEQTACIACHSLRLVQSQRLSTAAWTKEIDKMTGWGAVVPNRQKMIEYLAQEYSDNRPVPPPDKSVPR